MKIAILAFDRITALDAIGPYEVLSRLPGAQLSFVGLREGLVRTDNGMLGLQVDASLDATPNADVLVVPGGFGTDALCADASVLSWVRRVHETTTWTTSVCTGSLVLAAAGVLKGLEATTHWTCLDELARSGATPVRRRVVWQGKVITAAGVSAGIDMALALVAKIAGDDVARAIQLGIEYDPQPPFDCGTPDKAPPHLVTMLREYSALQRSTSKRK